MIFVVSTITDKLCETLLGTVVFRITELSQPDSWLLTASSKEKCDFRDYFLFHNVPHVVLVWRICYFKKE